MIELVLVTVAAAVVFAASALFVLHKQYHAGLLGNLGFGLLAIVAASRLASIVQLTLEGVEVRIQPQGVLLWIGLALVLGRQAWRFLARKAAGGPSWYDCRSAVRRRDEAANEAAAVERAS